MMPIGDDNSQRVITPWINYLLIAANIFVFVYYQGMGMNQSFTLSMATVPGEILSNTDLVGGEAGLRPTPIPIYATILTAMFMHGSVAHLLGNMLYLWVFGDNLENVMGHLKYLLFYLLCGVIATLCHVFASAVLNSGLMVPSLGASGAISGVLGGYLLMFPRNRVKVFAIPFVFHVPAFISLGLWILMQLVNSMGMLGGDYEGGGVAYAAHIGGFFAGMFLVRHFVNKRPARNF
ncbi:MAG: rhomboid family intramembrane serine protease [Niabella sp.]